MRKSLLAIVALAAGCDWQFQDFDGGWGTDSPGWWDDGSGAEFLQGEAIGFEQESTLFADTQGVALDESGQIGGAAMNTVTCAVYVDQGSIGSDVDPDYEDDETIVDSEPDEDGTGTIGLTVTTNGIHLVKWDDWDSGMLGSFPSAALDARFGGSSDEIVTIRNDGGSCLVEWLDSAGRDIAATSAAGNCRSGLVTLADGTAFVNTTAGVSVVTQSGSEVVAEAADLLAWDPTLDLLFTAERGGETITARRDDGSEVWVSRVNGAIEDIEVLGARGLLAVSVEHVDLTGELVLLDAATGESAAEAQTVRAARGLEASGDGTMVAAIERGQVHYISIR